MIPHKESNASFQFPAGVIWEPYVNTEFIFERKRFFIALSPVNFTFSHAHFSLWGRKTKTRMRESDEKTLALLAWNQLKLVLLNF